MATSGSVRSGAHGYNDSHLFINWQLAGQNIAENYSTINYQAYFQFNQFDAQLDNGKVWSSEGTHWHNSGRVKPFEGQITTRTFHLNSGSFRVYHNGDGTKRFSLGAHLAVFQNGTAQCSNAWDLPTIPRTSQVTTDKWVYTVGEPVTIYSNRKSDAFHHPISIHLPIGNWFTGNMTVYGHHVWQPNPEEIDRVYQLMANKRSETFRIVMDTYSGGTMIGSTVADRTVQVNDDVVRPTQPDFSYLDENSETTAITGNNQWLIQGKSKLRVQIAANQHAQPKYHATIRQYVFACADRSQAQNFSSGAMAASLGTINQEVDQLITLTAEDSRGLTNQRSKAVKLIPYSEPIINVEAKRVGSFENATKIKTSANFSPIKVNNTAKNNTTGFRWRYRDNEGGSWSGWEDLRHTTNTSNGIADVAELTRSFDNNKAWTLQFEFKDRLSTITKNVTLDAGVPIMRISPTTRKIYNEEEVLLQSHVGLIIISVTLDTPEKVEKKYGGKWVAHSAGRVLVGVGSNGVHNYPTANMTGGSDNVILTTQQMPRHNHSGMIWTPNNNHISLNGGIGQSHYALTWSKNGFADSYNIRTDYSGGNQPFDNRPAYSTAYIWRRTL